MFLFSENIFNRQVGCYVYKVYICIVMAKETLSIKIEVPIREALIREARKKEWTLSYYVSDLIKQHAKRKKLV